MNCPDCGLRFSVDSRTMEDMLAPYFRVSWQCPQRWGCGRVFYVNDRGLL